MKNYEKELSIIIPVYNGKDTIAKCLYSILNQIDNNTEVIVVDDGSTDNSVDICRRIAEKDNRVDIVEKENGGVSSARNVGIKAAVGKYIMFTDCDDVVKNGFFNAFLEKKELVNSDIIAISQIKIIKNNERLSYIEGESFAKESILDKDYLVDLWKECLWNSPVNKIYVSDVIRKNNISFPVGVKNGEDWMFNNAYARALKPRGFVILKSVCYDYYMSDNPYRHYKSDEFYEINKKQVEDFKDTINELELSKSEIDKFDKADLDFTITEMRRIARDSKTSSKFRLKRLREMNEVENVSVRVKEKSKQYSMTDRMEFMSGNALIIYIWENSRKMLGVLRRIISGKPYFSGGSSL